MSNGTDRNKQFLGVGIAMNAGFDAQGRLIRMDMGLDAQGRIALSSYDEHVLQSILLIVQTTPGERVMRPDFGAGLRRMVFEPINTSTMTLIQQRVEAALIAWEPRIEVQQVTVSAERAALGVLDIRIDYLVRTTNTFYNLVYPFYLQEAR
jgi:phage baseplate assembly protein W